MIAWSAKVVMVLAFFFSQVGAALLWIRSAFDLDQICLLGAGLLLIMFPGCKRGGSSYIIYSFNKDNAKYKGKMNQCQEKQAQNNHQTKNKGGLFVNFSSGTEIGSTGRITKR
jgi:hypothetical protein